MQLLASAETGAMTTLAYTAIRNCGTHHDPTLVELRTGFATLRSLILETTGVDTTTKSALPNLQGSSHQAEVTGSGVNE
jgi:hypothetical protein